MTESGCVTDANAVLGLRPLRMDSKLFPYLLLASIRSAWVSVRAPTESPAGLRENHVAKPHSIPGQVLPPILNRLRDFLKRVGGISGRADKRLQG